ncbi:DUF2281 domain-containing protein [Spirosoma montaniterrae]|uniref:DUF2281 domain-containing protein n=1 Tax=Spirosoma montaniterrae TaxID=1178516 RepID=A0A1P9WTN6_9BACT|nr:DUF2281 domain-containing protein [Spirosoma montaniterrae]AQG78756.1 hypothetical protein AWR27_05090 [Spirosoma montaniterrae]
MTYVQLYQKYQTLPPDRQAEVADFVEFLTTRVSPPQATPKKTPVFGSARGQFVIRPDFDAHLEDFADYQ